MKPLSVNAAAQTAKKVPAGILQHFSAKQIKILLVVTGAMISGIVLLYTQLLVNELREKEERTVRFYANVLRHYTDQNSNTEDFTFYLDGIIPTINFPIILTDADNEPLEPYFAYSLNVLDSVQVRQQNISKEQQRAMLLSILRDMEQTYQPIEIRASDGQLLTKLYYTNSNLITRLTLFPFIEIFVVAGFIFLGYIAFNYLRSAEQSNVWVGLAKEAAHQLGTPLSSLLAWLEILKMDAENPDQVFEIAGQMEQDVERLNKITHRFSKIGSLPEMREENISEIIRHVTLYFERRLPHLGKLVKIKRNIQSNVNLKVNAELFEWVIENLVKNAAEAMESGGGIIDILLEQKGSKTIILVCDNGKGMTQKVKREVFKPGFSTKKRGWGLGLSLCRRIIEDYHGGKIYIKDTAPGKGTVFAIELQGKSQKQCH